MLIEQVDQIRRHEVDEVNRIQKLVIHRKHSQVPGAELQSIYNSQILIQSITMWRKLKGQQKANISIQIQDRKI